MNKMQLLDQEARCFLKEQLNINLFVEAGAGSGKTSSLVARATALVTEGKAKLSEIAIVTFTRKAAGELQERLQIELESTCRSATGEAKLRALAAVDELHNCFIGTIHAFCSMMLRERPVEAGLSPDFKEIEGAEEQILEARAWNDYLALTSQQALSTLQPIGITPAQLFNSYQQLNTYPEVNFPAADSPYPDFGPVRQALRHLMTMAAAGLPAREPDKGWDTLQLKLRQIQRWDRSFDLQDDLVVAELLDKLEGNAGVTQNRWADKDTALGMKSAYETFQQEAAEPALSLWRQYRYLPIIEYLQPAVAYYDQLRREENCLNFQDLLLRTAAMLKEHAEVRAYFQRRFPILLVDEFQDTDPIQAEIMMYLAGDDVTEQDWTKILPRPGALFVVGDPKQSIYRFRRADVDIFYQIQKQIMEAGGEIISLTSNFRSLPMIVDWVNQTFSPLFEEGSAPGQVPYRSMLSNRSLPDDSMAGIKMINLQKEPRDGSDRIADQDAKRVAAFISETLTGEMSLTVDGSVGRQPVPDDFMILVPVKKHMAYYARELEVIGIPYSISGQNQLGNHIPLQELLYLAEVVADPYNPVLLAAVLRGLFYGFSDQDLYDFHQAGGSFCYLEALPPGLPGELQSKYAEAFEQLCRFRRVSRELLPTAALENMAEEVGVLPLLMQQSGSSGAANYYLLTENLHQAEPKGRFRFEQLIPFMRQFLESGVEDELDLTYGRARGVRIMNLHKAKGLEAPIVILADPASGTGGGVNMHVERQGCQSQGWLKVVQPIADFASRVLAYPEGWQELHDRETAYQEAERIRLLYVAATRAKDVLVISNYTGKPEKSRWASLVPDAENIEIVGDHSFVSEHPVTIDERLTAANDFWPQQEIRNERLRLSKTPSSKLATVTGIAHQGITYLPGSGKGRGPTWGNAVHRALEFLVFRPGLLNDTAWLTAVLTDAGVDEKELRDFRVLLTGVLNMNFWKRVQRAEVILTETAFGSWQDDCYSKGTIDLVFKEQDGWVIVDYKSDAVEGEGTLQVLTEHYRPQVEIYADYWQYLTGGKVIEKGILFTDILRWVSLTPPR
ncbi:MAG: UvrD-helicase domain-containing protein [Methylocystaceae bacterium]